MNERILTPRQLSEQIGFSEKTLANWRVIKQGPKYFKAGRLVRYYASDVDSWLLAFAPDSNVTPIDTRRRA